MRFTVLALLLTAGLTHGATEKLPAGSKLTRIDVNPTKITLARKFAYSQLVLTGTLANGDKIDVTRMVSFDAPKTLVTISETGQVRAVADGKGSIKLSLGGLSATIPVEISGQKIDFKASFVQDVMPIIARLGCNAGTCHGAESGKNGFKLSLRGYDPAFDHRAMTDDLSGRRFNRAAPDTSLMLLKTSGAVPHVGGVLTKSGEPYYEILRAWIADGVKLDTKSAKVKSITVTPAASIIPRIGQKQQVSVLATFTDGTVRDVTSEAFVESSNTEVATIDRAAVVKAVRRGETTVMARYEGAYAAATLIVMDIDKRLGFTWKPVKEYNWIDKLVYEKLKLVKVQPSDVCSDSEFLRRVYLDLTGLPPKPSEVRAFLADKTDSKTKREKVIDKLVGSEDFVEHWTNKWADLLQVNRKFLGDQGATKFRGWIKNAVATNMAYDKFAYSILTGKGSNIDNPQASYYKILRTADAAMENTTQLFLAVRFNCNKCHDHPFERWTQDQYYQLAAYFAQVGRTEDARYRGQRIGGSAVEGSVPLVEVIADLKGGDIKHGRTGLVSAPLFPYLHKDLAPVTASRREQVAKWITSKENQYFARSYVNRLWAYLLGVGLIEPIDDIRAGNPPTNPKLLDQLTAEFIKSNFDVRHIIKLIVKSRTYQHSVASNKWNEDDQINYSKALARRLPAEVLYDAIHRATGSVSQLRGLPAGARAAQLLDSAQDDPGGFFGLFGKPPRESACECERSGGFMLGPVLNLVNGPVVGNAIKDSNNRLAKLLRKEKDNTKVIEDIYLSVLCRFPTKKEIEVGLQALKDGEEDYADWAAEAKKLADALTAYEKGIPAKMAAWEKTLATKPIWQNLEVTAVKAAKGTTLTKQTDGSILASGQNPYPETYTISAKSTLTGITGIRLEVLTDKTLPSMGPGRAPNGNFVLSEFKVFAMEEGKKGKPTPVALFNPQASFNQTGLPVAFAIDNNPNTGWAIFGGVGKNQEAMFQFKKPLTFPKGTVFTVTMAQNYNGKLHNIGKFRLSVTTTTGTLSLSGPPANLAAILAIAKDKRTPQQVATLTAAYRAQDQEIARLNAAMANRPMPVDKRHPGAQDLVWALINSKAFQFNH